MQKRLASILGIAALVAVMFVALPVPPAAACSCAGGTADEHFERADVVFTGRLLDRKDPGMLSGGSSADFSTLRFDVDAVYKGEAAVDQAVVTEQSGASCGLEIEGPGPFLVFASNEHYDQQVPSDMLYAGLCAGTGELAPDQVSASFGAPRQPTAPPDGAEPATGAPSLHGYDVLPFFIGGVVSAVVVAGGALVFFRRRRSARSAT